jgi:2-polyprenyl-6-methoxyphenol hydroxylase-like FAD-dependent oxidoreductase
MRVLIIGGGIGGLTTALSLHKAGIEPVVFEQFARVEAGGFGINLQPNAVRELTELGLASAIETVAIETASTGYYNCFGQEIWTEPRGRAAGYAWPQYSIDRGDLHKILLNAVVERVGPGSMFWGHKLVSIEQTNSSVVAHFTERITARPLPAQIGDVLVGADGIHSAVRALLHPDEGPPAHSGRTQWRGVIETTPFLDGRSSVVVGSRDRRIVLYPMSEAARSRGRSLINWVAVLGNQPATGDVATWTRRASRDRFFDHFKTWQFDWLRCADLIAGTEEIFQFSSTDRDPLPRWSFGRVTMLGDAAHPMQPVGAQAGSQAVVDARVLSQALAIATSPEAGLVTYEQQRLPIMNKITLRNRELGPAIVLEMAEQRAPHGFTDIDAVIPRHELEEIARTFKSDAGLDPELLNKRSTLDAFAS